MNNYEQEAERLVGQLILYPENAKYNLDALNVLHDNEMIAFAEWCSNEGWIWASRPKQWVKVIDDKAVWKTTSELLTIFREENKNNTI